MSNAITTTQHLTGAQFQAMQLTRTSEAAFQATILELAHLQGWQTHHEYDSRRSSPGYPDLVLMRPPVILFRELKKETGHVTKAQQRWLDDLEACGLDAAVWRPRDWPQIVELLTTPWQTVRIDRPKAA